MEWYSYKESIVRPRNIGLRGVKLGIIVFPRRVYRWMKAAAGSSIIMKKNKGLVWAKRFLLQRMALRWFGRIRALQQP